MVNSVPINTGMKISLCHVDCISCGSYPVGGAGLYHNKSLWFVRKFLLTSDMAMEFEFSQTTKIPFFYILIATFYIFCFLFVLTVVLLTDTIASHCGFDIFFRLLAA